jgi:hypothetical protein
VIDKGSISSQLIAPLAGNGRPASCFQVLKEAFADQAPARRGLKEARFAQTSVDSNGSAAIACITNR